MDSVHQSRLNNSGHPPPRVSIGLPVYNGDQYIAEALNSLLAQTFRDFEIIVSDNCSTDNTAAIVGRYAERDPRIRYVRKEKNTGAVDNFNSIVALARGRFFKWAAHDDLIEPTYLERCVAVLEADDNVVLCHSDTQLISAEGTRLEALQTGSDHFFDEQGRIIYLGKDSALRKLDDLQAVERFKAVIMETNWVFEIFGVFRREVLVHTGLLDAFYGSDKLLLAKTAVLGRIVIVNEPLFLNRRHADQSMSLMTIDGQEVWVGNEETSQHGLMHRLRRMRGFFHATVIGKLSFRERAACWAVLLGYYVQFKRWYDMLEELSGLRIRRLTTEARNKMRQGGATNS